TLAMIRQSGVGPAIIESLKPPSSRWLYSSFHLIEQPIDAFWSVRRQTGGRNRAHGLDKLSGRPGARRSCAAFVEPAAILELAVGIVTEEVRRTDRSIRSSDRLGLVVEIRKREIMSFRETLHILK